MTRYAIQAYQIGANSNRVCTEINNGVFPATVPNYFFFNIGMNEIYVEAIYGTSFGWIGAIAGKTIKPGTGAVVDTGSRSYYWAGQKVYNTSNRRALVHCSTVKGYYSFEEGAPIELKIDINDLSKQLVSFGVGKIPVVGDSLSPLVDFFWPKEEESVWDQIKGKVNHLLDQRMKENIQTILGSILRYMLERITVLKMEIEDSKSHGTNRHYMNIAQDLVGFEKEFSVRSQDNSNYKNINYFLLPMYSAVVNLKVLFYQFGIINQAKIELTDDNIYNIKNYLNRVIEEKVDGAVVYITKVFKEQYDLEYDSCYPDAVYNALAVVRHHCAINGFEFFEYWRAILQNPMSEKKPYNTVISYSTIFARPTPVLSTQMVGEVPVPLQPKMVNGKRNRMKKWEVWIFRMGGGTPKIQGLKIFYENGDTHEMGKHSDERKTIDFKGAYLKKLTAWGHDALDMFEMEFDDGRKDSCGSNADSRGTSKAFELKFHHIAGIFVANDATALGGQSAGVSVSYQLTPQS